MLLKHILIPSQRRIKSLIKTNPTSSPANEKIIAFVALRSISQQLLMHTDRLKSGRLPGNTVIIHGNRRAIELKILLHRQEHYLRIYQDGIEVCDNVKLRELDDRVVLRVQEEPLPEDTIPYLVTLVKYRVDQKLIGNMLPNDPEVLCYGMYDGPSLLPFV